jgi:hypothetical protein
MEWSARAIAKGIKQHSPAPVVGAWVDPISAEPRGEAGNDMVAAISLMNIAERANDFFIVK